MLKIEDLSLKVGGFSLEGITLKIEKGDFFALIGPTGSGKSLLLETIMGIVPSNCTEKKGKIILENKEITSLPPERRGIGIVYQDSALFPHLSVKENITFGLRYYRGDRKDIQERLKATIESLEIGHLLDRSPETLSGGERQRVALARVLVLNPRIILLDEPLSAIDPNFQEEIRNLLKDIHKNLGITFIMVSHNFSEVLHLAEKGAIISEGKILQQGNIWDIFNHPNSLFVAKFVGIKNIYPAKIEKRKAILSGGIILNLSSNGASSNHNYLTLRGENIFLNPPPSLSLENIFKGRIIHISSSGFHLNIKVEVGRLQFHIITLLSNDTMPPYREGEQITIGFTASSLHTFYE